jgi:hypothetical protein
MPLKSLFNGSKKRKLPPRKTKEKDVPSARAKSTHLAGYWPHDDRDMQELYGRQLVEWSRLETSWDIDIFFNEKNIGGMKFYSACKDNAFLDECWDIALANIGMRLKETLRDSFEYKMKTYPKYETLARLERKEKLALAQEAKETEYKLIVNRG